MAFADQMATTSLGFDAADGARRLRTVSKVPLYSPDGTVWPSAFCTRTDDSGAALGVVGPRYKPLQNHQLAEALDVAFRHLPACVRPRIVNAGTLGAGAGLGVGGSASWAKTRALLVSLPAELSALCCRACWLVVKGSNPSYPSDLTTARNDRHGPDENPSMLFPFTPPAIAVTPPQQPPAIVQTVEVKQAAPPTATLAGPTRAEDVFPTLAFPAVTVASAGLFFSFVQSRAKKAAAPAMQEYALRLAAHHEELQQLAMLRRGRLVSQPSVETPGVESAPGLPKTTVDPD